MLRPWNELSSETISILLLDTLLPCERIIFTAPSIASVPELQKNLLFYLAISPSQFGAVVEQLAVADGHHRAALRLFLGRLRQENPGRRLLLLLDGLNDHAVAQGLEVHE